LGIEGVAAAKKKLGLPVDKNFYVVPEAYSYYQSKQAGWAQAEKEWKDEFSAWSAENPDLRKEWNAFYAGKPTGTAADPVYKVGDKLATRAASGAMLNVMADRYGNLVGGSADLMGPNKTKIIHDDGTYTPENRKGRTIEFGIREFAMSAVSAGIRLHGGLRPFCATFLIFSDYLRPSLRLAALMKLNTIYIFTHDSIYVGEDGPTHQPVETLAALRAIPNVQVLRPGDAEESEAAWEMAMESCDHPVCLAFTRQGLPVYEKADPDWKNTVRTGAYIVREGASEPDITILATGSEVSLALEAVKLVPDKKIRVVSVMDRTLFGMQNSVIRNKIIGGSKRVVTAEAGVAMGWEGFATSRDDIFCIDRFGESGPASKVAEALGFTAQKLAELLEK
jgi:transketolase